MGRNSKFCKFRKPKISNPLTLTSDSKIIWKTDRRLKERGFECFLLCSDNCLTTSANTGSASATPTHTKCRVEGGANNRESCTFPFAYNGHRYDGCAFDQTRDVAPWCFDSLGNRGFCSTDCPLDPSFSTGSPNPSPSPAMRCACGIRRSRIVHGQESAVNEFPWMVGLSHKWSLRPFCGGVLISDQYILSAAHCCVGREVDDINVFLGDHNWMNSTETASFRRRVLSIKIHPEYGQPVAFNYDACLIKIEPVDFSRHQHIQPACLPDIPAHDYDQALGVVAGWGLT